MILEPFVVLKEYFCVKLDHNSLKIILQTFSHTKCAIQKLEGILEQFVICDEHEFSKVNF